MRTKTLLIAASVIAAGVASSMAQSNVYSLNVVGYVNKAYVSGFNAVANPLTGTDNSLDAIMAGSQVPDNTIVFLWDPALQDFSPTLPTYNAGGGNWVPNATVNPGTGFFVFAPAAFTNTFVGEVVQGSTTIPIVPSFNAIASAPPIGGSVADVLAQLPAADNDLALKWDPVAQDFGTISTYSQASTSWVPDVQFEVGEGILYFRSGAAVDWVRTFNVPQD
jgi:hypothetical protein